MASYYRREIGAAQMSALVSFTSAAFVFVTPADAGAHLGGRLRKHAGWMPAGAGMTGFNEHDGIIIVTPADAGAHLSGRLRKHAGWMPACAGMTG